MSSDVPETTHQQKPRRPRFRTVAIVLAVLFLGVWFLSPAGTVESPVRLERDADGQLQEISEPQDSSLHFGAHLTSLSASNQTVTGSSSSHPNPAWFRCESILIVNRSDHLLMKRIGESVVEKLKQDPHLDRIDYLPQGHLPEAGRLAPDLVVTLRLESIDASGITGRKLKAKIVKNKVAPPFRIAEFDMLSRRGISLEGDLIDMGVEDRIVQKSGSWFSYGETRLGQGRDKARIFLEENPEITDEIKRKILIARGHEDLLNPADQPAEEPAQEEAE